MTPAGESDAGQNHLSRAEGKILFDRLQHLRNGHGHARAAPLWNDAEGARVITPVLHRDKGAGVPTLSRSQRERTSAMAWRSSAARALIVAGCNCGMRAAGVPGRAEYGKTCP